jgi:voltage-gated potassium channel
VVTVASRRRQFVHTALRTAASLCIVVAAYYVAPLDRPLDGGTILLFGGALLLFALLAALQVRAILRSPRPRLQAIRGLLLGVPLLMVVFAATYVTVDAQQTDAFSEALSRTDGLYFTVTVFATVGFGDISPVSELARILVTIQMLVGLLAVGVIAKVMFGAVQVAETRRARQLLPSTARGDD